MENKISLTTLLIDIRSRNLVHVSQEDITQSLNERGYNDSLGDVKEKMQTLGRLYYIARDTTKSGYRLVNPTLQTSFTGCVWCGRTTSRNAVCRTCETTDE